MPHSALGNIHAMDLANRLRHAQHRGFEGGAVPEEVIVVAGNHCGPECRDGRSEVDVRLSTVGKPLSVRIHGDVPPNLPIEGGRRPCELDLAITPNEVWERKGSSAYDGGDPDQSNPGTNLPK